MRGGGDEAVLIVGKITAPPEYQNQLQHLISLHKDLFAEPKIMVITRPSGYCRIGQP